jgi:hypothetical protein
MVGFLFCLVGWLVDDCATRRSWSCAGVHMWHPHVGLGHGHWVAPSAVMSHTVRVTATGVWAAQGSRQSVPLLAAALQVSA